MNKEEFAQEYKILMGRYNALVKKIPKLREMLEEKKEYVPAYRVGKNIEASCISIRDDLKKSYNALKAPVMGRIYFWIKTLE